MKNKDVIDIDGDYSDHLLRAFGKTAGTGVADRLTAATHNQISSRYVLSDRWCSATGLHKATKLKHRALKAKLYITARNPRTVKL